MDPHWTYDPPAEWRARFGPEDPRPFEVYRALDARERTIGPIIFRNDMPADEVRAFVDLYDAEIRFTDESIGRLLSFLDRQGLGERTLVVVTADHGESLGEHGYFFEHGDLGTEPEVHVPLVFSQPGRIPAGLRVPWTVRSLDVAPTVLDLVGLPVEQGFRGESLTALMGPSDDPSRSRDRICFGETDDALHEENTRREVRGIAGKWRWPGGPIQDDARPEGERERLPAGLRSRGGPRGDARRGRRAPRRREALRRGARPLDREDSMQEREYHVSPESRALLRSLGYVN